MTFWNGYVIGRVGSSSWSLPKAMRLAVNVRKPRSTSRARAPIVKRESAGVRR